MYEGENRQVKKDEEKKQEIDIGYSTQPIKRKAILENQNETFDDVDPKRLMNTNNEPNEKTAASEKPRPSSAVNEKKASDIMINPAEVLYQ